MATSSSRRSPGQPSYDPSLVEVKSKVGWLAGGVTIVTWGMIIITWEREGGCERETEREGVLRCFHDSSFDNNKTIIKRECFEHTHYTYIHTHVHLYMYTYTCLSLN